MEQLECAAVGKFLLFHVDVIVCFVDKSGQHLQFWLLHFVEWVVLSGDSLNVMGVSERGGCFTPLSIALVRVFARFFDFLSPSFGQGTKSFWFDCCSDV